MWDLKLLYKSIQDPQIEIDLKEIEGLCATFAQNYKDGFINDSQKLLQSLKDYFAIEGKYTPKPIIYLTLLVHSDSRNEKARSMLNLVTNRMTKCGNFITFYSVELGKMNKEKQKAVLEDPKFLTYRFFLKSIFDTARYDLSEAEEKIMNLKSLPAYDMWVDSHDKVLAKITLKWKGKIVSLPYAMNMIAELKQADRVKLSGLINTELKKISFFSEAELNAIVTNKKINDELRGYATPYESTVVGYKNDPKVVETLVKTVTSHFHVSHSFYKIKAKLLKLKKLHYSDRQANYKKIKRDFSFEKSKTELSKILKAFDPQYSEIFDRYIKNGQIDVLSRIGKRGGAYCWGNFASPTFVMLNHANNLYAFETLAHEMGHAFHTELSRSQGPVYMNYSTAVAETASTFFQGLAFNAIFETLSPQEKVVALHDKINSEISTVFRQIACFNFELDIHQTIRKNGFISAEDLAALHNKHMRAYLGPVFDLQPDEGYFFVQWPHIRSFFYVYTYAYGLLVSKVLLKRYKEDNNFVKSIEKFLSAGGKDTPENIFKEIGIDISSPGFFEEGIGEIEKDIKLLQKLARS